MRHNSPSSSLSTASASVVALYVDTESGPYPALLGVERCWGVARDGKLYNGPHSVVAHPPCRAGASLRGAFARSAAAPMTVARVPWPKSGRSVAFWSTLWARVSGSTATSPAPARAAMPGAASPSR